MFTKIIKNSLKESYGFGYFNLYKRYFNNIGNKTLIYHAFGSELNHDTYGISIDIKKFREHMTYLNDNYQFHSLKNSFNDEMSISITIDDGYKDSLDAINILNDLKIPFSIFITTDMISKPLYLNEEDIHDIEKLETAQVGSHGKTHTKLGQLTESRQRIELSKSKDVLENICRSNINSISLPHGSFNNITLNLASSLGYKLIATSIKGFNNTSNNSIIKRNEIIKSDNINDLEKKIKGYYDFY